MTETTQFLDTRGLAALLGVSVPTLTRLRLYDTDQSPPFVKVGARVLYPRTAVESWVSARMQGDVQ